MSMTTNGGSLIWSSYINMYNDVKSWLQIPTSDVSKDYQLQLITDMACQWVQRYIGRPVAPTQFARRFDGWSGWMGSTIELPYYPVLEVVTVTEWWGSNGPHVLTESTPENQVDGFQIEYLTGRLVRIFPGLVQKPWFPGSRNIEVTWVAGYNPVPADIQVATLELIAHWFHNTQQQSGIRTAAFTDADDYSPMDTSSLWTGVPLRIIDLLEPYTQIGLG